MGMSDDLLTPAELEALLAPHRIITEGDAMTRSAWERKMETRSRPVTDLGASERPLRGRNQEMIAVRSIGDLIVPHVQLNRERARKSRAKAAAKEASPLDPVARPLLTAARAYSWTLRPCHVHA